MKVFILSIAMSLVLLASGCSKPADNIDEELKNYGYEAINCSNDFLAGEMPESEFEKRFEYYNDLCDEWKSKHEGNSDELETLFYISTMNRLNAKDCNTDLKEILNIENEAPSTSVNEGYDEWLNDKDQSLSNDYTSYIAIPEVKAVLVDCTNLTQIADEAYKTDNTDEMLKNANAAIELYDQFLALDISEVPNSLIGYHGCMVSYATFSKKYLEELSNGESEAAEVFRLTALDELRKAGEELSKSKG